MFQLNGLSDRDESAPFRKTKATDYARHGTPDYFGHWRGQFASSCWPNRRRGLFRRGRAIVTILERNATKASGTSWDW